MVNQLTKDKKYNLKIYSMYRSISIDYLFYYVIEFLFLTQAKGLSESAVALSYTFYAIYKIMVQMPVNIIRNHIGNKNSIILGNSLNFVYILFIMSCDSPIKLYFSTILSATGFAFKDISDLSLLKLSLPKTSNQGEIYAKSESKGFKNYYLINALASVLSGSLFIINVYLPLICSAILIAISIFIALGFKDIKEDETQVSKKDTKKYINEIKKQNKFILKSPRLRCIYIYVGLMTGMFNLFTTYRTSILVHINVPNQYITVIVALVGLTCSIGSKFQEKYTKKFTNKSFAIIILYISSAITIIGLLSKYVINDIVKVALICYFIVSIGIFQGLYNVLYTKYLGNFVDDKILPQILSVNDVCRCILIAIINGIGSALLNSYAITESMILFGFGILVVSVALVIYMKPRFGLKPEEYTKKDIYDLKAIN